jgi:hypothetical protein
MDCPADKAVAWVVASQQRVRHPARLRDQLSDEGTLQLTPVHLFNVTCSASPDVRITPLGQTRWDDIVVC